VALDPDMHRKGAIDSANTSWPLIQESLATFGVSFQQAQAKLIASGYPCGPTDRLPFQIVADVLEREGYEPERLLRVGP
jgi:hypothetical protein